jgi:hypothetical protein
MLAIAFADKASVREIDAINIYNDAKTLRPRALPPPD